MKKLIATRKLKRHCIFCNSEIEKGSVYYKKRVIITDNGIYSHEYLVCPKCKYKNERQLKRFKTFKEKCIHPTEFIATQYSYIQGEAVQEPNYDFCQLCGELVH